LHIRGDSQKEKFKYSNIPRSKKLGDVPDPAPGTSRCDVFGENREKADTMEDRMMC
jgi:hypothetical protein